MEFKEVINNYLRMCNYTPICCFDCELRKIKLCTDDCTLDFECEDDIAQFENIVTKWANEHPIKTNGEILKELVEKNFDVNFADNDIQKYETCFMINCPSDEHHCKDCKYHNFWNKEYKRRIR